MYVCMYECWYTRQCKYTSTTYDNDDDDDDCVYAFVMMSICMSICMYEYICMSLCMHECMY